MQWVPPRRAGAAAPLPGVKRVVGETAKEAELINKISWSILISVLTGLF